MLPFAISINVVSMLSVTPLWMDTVFLGTVLPYLLMIPTFLLVTCPGMACVMRGVVSAVTGDRAVAAQRMRYGRDLGLGLRMLVRFLMPPMIVLVAWCLPRMWLDENLFLGILVGAVSACVGFGLMLLCFYLLRRGFFVPYLTACGCSAKEARHRSRLMVAASPRLPLAYVFSFLGMLALSVLSLGVLFIFWTLPLMWTTYVRAASSLQNEQSHLGIE